MKLRELIESTLDISNDVEKIYRRYMSNDLPTLLSNGYNSLKPKVLSPDTVEKLLISPQAIEAFKKSPISISFYKKPPMYAPLEKTIYLNFDDDLIKHLLTYGSLEDIKKNIPQAKFMHIKQAATQETTEAIISHELSHWVRDALGNQYLDKSIRKFASRGGDENRKAVKQVNGGYNDPYLTNAEIDAQVHELLPLYKKYSKYWDEMTWNELMYLSTALHKRNQKLSPEDKEIWKRKMKSRMQREGILGVKMRNT